MSGRCACGSYSDSWSGSLQTCSSILILLHEVSVDCVSISLYLHPVLPIINVTMLSDIPILQSESDVPFSHCPCGLDPLLSLVQFPCFHSRITQSLQSELAISHEEVRQWKGRACELEQVVTDREEEVKIVEKKSLSLVS